MIYTPLKVHMYQAPFYFFVRTIQVIQETAI
jgi:hypothetical protein